MIGCLSHTPNQGLGSQPRRVPWLGIKPVTFWFVRWCPTHKPHQSRLIVLLNSHTAFCYVSLCHIFIFFHLYHLKKFFFTYLTSLPLSSLCLGSAVWTQYHFKSRHNAHQSTHMHEWFSPGTASESWFVSIPEARDTHFQTTLPKSRHKLMLGQLDVKVPLSPRSSPKQLSLLSCLYIWLRSGRHLIISVYIHLITRVLSYSVLYHLFSNTT